MMKRLVPSRDRKYDVSMSNLKPHMFIRRLMRDLIESCLV